MKISKTCIAVLLFATCVASQTTKPDDTRTGSFLNGRAWRDWGTLGQEGDAMKLGFLMGYSDGLTVGIIAGYAVAPSATPDVNHSDLDRKLHSLRDGFDPSGALNYGETERAVDRFYEDPLNDPISIKDCLGIVSDQAHGKDPKLIDAKIRDFRKSAAEKLKEQK